MRSACLLLIGSSVLAGCAGSGAAGSASTMSTNSTVVLEETSTSTGTVAPQLDGLTAELVITRQRDLLDRGLINVMTTNDSGQDVLITNRELVADYFAGSPAGLRSTSVRDGRQIAIQVPYGVADDCDTDGLVTANFEVTYTTPDDSTERVATIPVSGTDILDGIRAKQCAAQVVDAVTDISFADTAIVDGTLTTQLVVESTGDATNIEVADTTGTILVDAHPSDAFAGVTFGAEGDTVTIPITFSVNRCDPHALAEVTKRYGLDLRVSIDGEPLQPVPVDVSSLTDQLEAIVQSCRYATDAD